MDLFDNLAAMSHIMTLKNFEKLSDVERKKVFRRFNFPRTLLPQISIDKSYYNGILMVRPEKRKIINTALERLRMLYQYFFEKVCYSGFENLLGIRSKTIIRCAYAIVANKLRKDLKYLFDCEVKLMEVQGRYHLEKSKAVLESSWRMSPPLNKLERKLLAEQCKISLKQVDNWVWLLFYFI